MILASNIELSI